MMRPGGGVKQHLLLQGPMPIPDLELARNDRDWETTQDNKSFVFILIPLSAACIEPGLRKDIGI